MKPIYIVAVAVLIVATACSGASGKGQTLGPTNTTVPVTRPGYCNGAQLTSAETGVSPSAITVTTIADVQNGFRPGLFKSAWDGMKAWANYVNDHGGLACRQVVVNTVDSKLTGDDAKTGEAAACGNSLALVGTTALFLKDVSASENCKDKAGATTGLPDLATIQTDSVQQCSPLSFAVFPISGSCPYKGTGPRHYTMGRTAWDYYIKKFGPLHGTFTVAKDLPSTIESSIAVFRGANAAGISRDAEIGMSGTATQPDYTAVVNAIKQHNSTYATNGLDYKGTVLERKEAAAQGVNSVKAWDCTFQCYDKRLIEEGGPAMEGQYVWLGSLPFEDKGANAELDSFLKYDQTPDGFGLEAWLAGEEFARAVTDAIAAHNNDPNAITRADVLAAIRNMHDFTGGGLTPPLDIGNKKGSPCAVGVQVQNGKFVRVDPVQPGTFDCNNNATVEITIDPLAEYHG